MKPSDSLFCPGAELFPGFVLKEGEAALLARLQPLYADWNAKINVVSRKDFETFEERHVLHSLAMATVLRFLPGSRVLDIGTGGGFPGIPLAILHPDTEFILCDSIGKKIKVVQAVIDDLGLKNVTAIHGRAEALSIEPVDFVVSRAVTRFAQFLPFAAPHISKVNRHEQPNGILYLKGGDLAEELAELPRNWSVDVHRLGPLFPDRAFFETKFVVFAKNQKTRGPGGLG